jgi:hypothetical protein
MALMPALSPDRQPFADGEARRYVKNSSFEPLETLRFSGEGVVSMPT